LAFGFKQAGKSDFSKIFSALRAVIFPVKETHLKITAQMVK